MDDPAANSDEKLRLQLAQAALHALPDGYVLVDTAGRIIDINPGALHLTGWAEAEALGRPLHDVVQLRDSKGRAVDLLHAHNGTDVTMLIRRDQHQVLVDASFAHIVDPLDQKRRALGSVVTFRNVTAAARLNDELTYHATHDALTGAFNRRAFESRLKRAVTNAAQDGTPHALVFLDMDRFKAVNDEGGHFAGDELLRGFTALLQRSLRDHDTLARLGGDEFALLLEHCVPAQAELVATRILEAVAKLRFQWQEHEFTVGVSMGLVTFRNGALSPRNLLQRADELCYLAKAHGGQRVEVYEVPPLPRTPARKRATPARPRTKPLPLRH